MRKVALISKVTDSHVTVIVVGESGKKLMLDEIGE
jgi:hypothetical protein